MSSKPDDQYNLYGVIVLTILSIVLLYGGMGGIKDTIEYVNRPEYVETQGVVVTMSKGPGIGRGRNSHPLFGTYEFSVNATPYTGTQIGQHARGALWRVNKANRIVEYFKQNKQITVRYDPNNPSRNYADVGGEVVSIGTIAIYSAFVVMVGVVCLALWIRMVVIFVSRLKRA